VIRRFRRNSLGLLFEPDCRTRMAANSNTDSNEGLTRTISNRKQPFHQIPASLLTNLPIAISLQLAVKARNVTSTSDAVIPRCAHGFVSIRQDRRRQHRRAGIPSSCCYAKDHLCQRLFRALPQNRVTSGSSESVRPETKRKTTRTRQTIRINVRVVACE